MFTRKPDAASGAVPNGLTQSLGQMARAPSPLVQPATIMPSIASVISANPVSVVEPEEAVVVVGRGARIEGKIGDCRKLDVHGILEGDAVADTVVIREGGGIKGTLQTKRAEIHGVFEGTLLVQDHLEIFRSGDVTGEVSYRTLSIQTGGKLRGSIINSEAAQADDAQSSSASADIIPMKQPVASAASDGGGDPSLALTT